MNQIELEMIPQPDDVTCGPTCLAAVYRFFDDPVPLPEVIAEVPQLATGGTLGVLLGCHALERGYRVTMHPYNLKVFDPTWFRLDAAPLAENLRARMTALTRPRLRAAIPAYLRYLELGGKVAWEELRPSLLRRYLERGLPILTGLSATYLYDEARDDPQTNKSDPIGGAPTGHFVTLCGYDSLSGRVEIADPWSANPHSPTLHYEIGIERVLGAILLGVITYDGNLIIIEPS
ncbi:MAG: hypothetical protein H6807_00795 [Planctomycetes bacterium]|nr:hypothetical protein [Planctomycetota bacterium]